VKDYLFGLFALAKNLVLFCGALQFNSKLVSKPCIFTVLYLNEVCLPLTDLEFVSSAYFSTVLSWALHQVLMRSGW